VASTCRAAALAAVLWAAGCATPDGGSNVPRAGEDGKAEEPSSKSAHARGGVLDAETARAETERILEGIAKARNLELTKRVEVDVVDKAQVRGFVRANLYEHMTREEFELQGRIASAMGVIPVGSDPEAIFLDMLEEGILGYYDPKTKTLFIGDFVPPFMLSRVVGHEIAHGLQDMHVDLAKHQAPLDHRSDAASARTFLIEGEAEAAYYAWVSGADGLSSIDDAVFDAMGNQALDYAKAASEYPVLARDLQMPYADGAATVVRLVIAKGWPAVDALWKDLPTTSEQMLHLDKLLAREPAKPVRLDAAALEQATSMKTVWFDELGEASLLAMLADAEPSTIARAAAKGWGGGQLLALADPAEPESAPTIVAALVWDTPEDAAEFEVAFAKYLDTATPKGTFIARRRDAVVFGTNVPERIATKPLVAAAWGALSHAPQGLRARTKGGNT
jgi:hypothetical protein